MENIPMKKAEYFLNATLIVSSLVLALTYFLPVEASWAPFDAWKGYLEPSTGRFVQGLSISLFEVFPYAVGIIVLLYIEIIFCKNTRLYNYSTNITLKFFFSVPQYRVLVQ